MKVIFLDFDGVINNWDNFNGVDFKNVEKLLMLLVLRLFPQLQINMTFKYI